MRINFTAIKDKFFSFKIKSTKCVPLKDMGINDFIGIDLEAANRTIDIYCCSETSVSEQQPLKNGKMRSILQDLQAKRRLAENQPGF